MSFNFKNFWHGIRIVPKDGSNVSVLGEMDVTNIDGKLNYHNGSTISQMVTEDHVGTLTNKTISANSNTITDITNASIDSAAAISRTKLASGTASHVLVNDGTGVMTSEATLAKTRGGSGQDNSSLTFPASGTLATLAGSEALTNKTINAASNTISNISNSEVKSGAAIARNKLASGTASHVLINDGSGVMSSEATLAKSRGGTGQDNSSLSFPASGIIVERDASQTLTNKTISGSSNTLTNISATSLSSGAATVGSVLVADGIGGASYSSASGSGARNYIINGAFDIWQRGTSISVNNGVTSYTTDRWYTKNTLGTLGGTTSEQSTGAVDGSLYGLKAWITNTPSGSQANGLEVYHVLSNRDSYDFYNKTASFGVWIKAAGNTTQVGIQFVYATSETKPSTSVATPSQNAIGSEQTFTVNSSGFTYCSFSQAIGTSATTSGVIGIRIRQTTVSSGQLYTFGNGFILEQAMLNLGSQLSPTFVRAGGGNPAAELRLCQAFYETSFASVTVPTATTSGSVQVYATLSTISLQVPIFLKVTKIKAGTVTVYSTQSATAAKFYNQTGAADVDAAVGSGTGVNIFNVKTSSNATAASLYLFHWVYDAEI